MLSRCRRCALVLTAKVPDCSYAHDYFVEGGQGYNFNSPFARAFDAERFERELTSLEARGLSGTILDVGCALGTFLTHARARGWRVEGIETSEFARRAASAGLGMPVKGSFDELPAGVRYDVVTLHHVLEHIHDPVAFLASHLPSRVGRLLLVEVPNFASLGARTDGLRWKDLRLEQHVQHFEPATLRGTLEAAGFQVERIYTLGEPLWSLHAARRTVRSLGALGGRAHLVPADPPSLPPAPPMDWLPPRGLRAGLVEASRVALLPLVRWIERTNRGERLVAEARPRALSS
jgi:SAM-dependent methyltransferase